MSKWRDVLGGKPKKPGMYLIHSNNKTKIAYFYKDSFYKPEDYRFYNKSKISEEQLEYLIPDAKPIRVVDYWTEMQAFPGQAVIKQQRDMSIASFTRSKAFVEALKKKGIKTVGKALEKPMYLLEDIKGVNKKTLADFVWNVGKYHHFPKRWGDFLDIMDFINKADSERDAIVWEYSKETFYALFEFCMDEVETIRGLYFYNIDEFEVHVLDRGINSDEINNNMLRSSPLFQGEIPFHYVPGIKMMFSTNPHARTLHKLYWNSDAQSKL